MDVSRNGWSDDSRTICRDAGLGLVFSAFVAVFLVVMHGRLAYVVEPWMGWAAAAMPFSLLHAGLAVMWLTGRLPKGFRSAAPVPPPHPGNDSQETHCEDWVTSVNLKV